MQPDATFPKADTCFFNVMLPQYSTQARAPLHCHFCLTFLVLGNFEGEAVFCDQQYRQYGCRRAGWRWGGMGGRPARGRQRWVGRLARFSAISLRKSSFRNINALPWKVADDVACESCVKGTCRQSIGCLGEERNTKISSNITL